MRRRLGVLLALTLLPSPMLVDVVSVPPKGSGSGGSLSWPVVAPTGGALQTGTTATNTLLLQAYDNNTGPGYVTMATLTAGNEPWIGFHDGSCSYPSLGWTSDMDGTGTGFYRNTNSNMAFCSNGQYFFKLSNNGISVISTSGFNFQSGAATASGIDGGIARDAAGILRISNAGPGINALRLAAPQNTQIATYTTTAAGSGNLINNTGDTDGSTITLMNDPVGSQTDVLPYWKFAVVAAQTVTIQPSAGETLYCPGTGAVASISSNTPGAFATIYTINPGSGGAFTAVLTAGWTCTP